MSMAPPRRGDHSRWMRTCLLVAAAFGVTAAACTESASPVEPDCKNPAPLLGEPGPRMVGYVVLFHDDVDAFGETARLARVYQIEPTYVTDFIPVFFASFSDDVRDRLRCEPAVQQVEYDQSGTPPPDGAGS